MWKCLCIATLLFMPACAQDGSNHEGHSHEEEGEHSEYEGVTSYAAVFAAADAPDGVYLAVPKTEDGHTLSDEPVPVAFSCVPTAEVMPVFEHAEDAAASAGITVEMLTLVESTYQTDHSISYPADCAFVQVWIYFEDHDEDGDGHSSHEEDHSSHEEDHSSHVDGDSSHEGNATDPVGNATDPVLDDGNATAVNAAGGRRRLQTLPPPFFVRDPVTGNLIPLLGFKFNGILAPAPEKAAWWLPCAPPPPPSPPPRPLTNSCAGSSRRGSSTSLPSLGLSPL
jgi:hypothetical protein